MTTQGIPRLKTVSTLRSPFGFVRTSDLPTEHHREFLTFTIPSEDMRLSEARAWADTQALQWAKVNRTVIVGDVDWRFDESKVHALVRTTIAPRVRGARPIDDTPLTRPREDRRTPAPHVGCDICERVAAFGPEYTRADVASALGISTSTVTRHRVTGKATT